MRMTTTTNIHHASKVVVEEHTGETTKWLTFSIRNKDGLEEADFSVFDLDLTDLIIEPDNRPEAVIADFMKGFVEVES
jgi:hypothetical protein